MKIKLSVNSINKWILFFFSISIVLLVTICISRIVYPYDSGQYEAGVWAPSQLVSNFVNPYHFNHTYQAPYTMAPYGVLYYYIVGIGLKFFGIQFWFARVLSVVGLIICVICIHTIVIKFTENTKYSFLGIVIFLTQFSVQSWIGIQRPDILSLTFILMSITFVLLHKPKQKYDIVYSIIIPALLVVFAILIRQTSILPIGFIAGHFFFNKKYKYFFAFISVVFMLLMLVMFQLNETSNNGYMWQQFIMPSSIEKKLDTGLTHFKAFFLSPSTFFVFLLFIVGGVMSRFKRIANSIVSEKKKNIDVTLLQSYVLISLLFSVVTASRMGSNINYYLETSTVIAIFIPIYFFEKNQSFLLKKEYHLFLILIILSSIFTEIRVFRGEYFRWKSKDYYCEIVNTIKKLTPPEIPSFSVYPELVAFANRENYFNDFVQYDGRAPLQHNIYNTIYNSPFFASIVTYDSIAPAGYYKYNLKNKKPEKYHVVYLFLRDDIGIKSNSIQ